MITIYNRQRTYSVDTQQLRTDITRVLKHLGYADFAMSVWITTNATIQKYNTQFRGKNKATDVLSFPFHHDVQPGERIMPADDEERVLGDIIISAEYVSRQARELHVPFYQRLRRLVVHGICHLLGYDHQTDAQYQVMFALEKKLLSLFDQDINE